MTSWPARLPCRDNAKPPIDVDRTCPATGRENDFCATLLAMACHDLRQPLQVIIGAHDVLAEILLGGTERVQLSRVAGAATQLAGTLDRLVGVLRLCDAATGIHHEPVSLAAVLDPLVSEFLDAARLNGVELRILPASATVFSNHSLLSGILRNLIRNAIDYTPRGGRVLVICRRRGTAIRIEVRDNGVGIPADEIARIFKPFHRIDQTRRDGLGLGLFIVQRAADFLGHRVEVRSAIDRGSCFAVVCCAGASLSATGDGG
jgi:signal transduction histidine kinase